MTAYLLPQKALLRQAPHLFCIDAKRGQDLFHTWMFRKVLRISFGVELQPSFELLSLIFYQFTILSFQFRLLLLYLHDRMLLEFLCEDLCSIHLDTSFPRFAGWIWLCGDNLLIPGLDFSYQLNMCFFVLLLLFVCF